MDKVRFGDVVKRVNIYVDRFNTDRLYYVGKGGSIEPDALDIKPQAKIEGATIGFKFHFGFEPGHILFMSRCFDQHKAATATFRGVCSDSTYVVETRDNNVLLQQYLQLVMQTDDFWNWCEEHKSGGVNFLINYSTLETYEFDLPSIGEQKVLADKLWAAYRVKEAYRQLLSTTDEMLKAKFQEMFGDGKWEQKTLGEVGSFQRGGGFQKDDYVEKGIPCIHYGQIHTKFGPYIYTHLTEISSELETKTKYAVKGDLVIAITSEDEEGSCKSTAWLGDYTVAVGGHAAIFHHRMDPLFMAFYFKSSAFNHEKVKYTRGSKVIEIKPDDVAKIHVPVPPMELQQQFAEIATQAEATKASLRASIEAIDRVIRSLINQ